MPAECRSTRTSSQRRSRSCTTFTLHAPKNASMPTHKHTASRNDTHTHSHTCQTHTIIHAHTHTHAQGLTQPSGYQKQSMHTSDTNTHSKTWTKTRVGRNENNEMMKAQTPSSSLCPQQIVGSGGRGSSLHTLLRFEACTLKIHSPVAKYSWLHSNTSRGMWLNHLREVRDHLFGRFLWITTWSCWCLRQYSAPKR